MGTMYYHPPRTSNRSIILFLSTSPRHSLLTLEAFLAPSEALLDATKALLTTSDSDSDSPSRVSWMPFRSVTGGPPRSLEALQVPRRLFPFPFHAMALSAPSKKLLTPSEVPQQPSMPSQLPLRPFKLPPKPSHLYFRLFPLPPLIY